MATYAKRGGGKVTVRFVVPMTEPEVAWIVVVPAASPVASPEVLIDATVWLEELQLTAAVRF